MLSVFTEETNSWQMIPGSRTQQRLANQDFPRVTLEYYIESQAVGRGEKEQNQPMPRASLQRAHYDRRSQLERYNRCLCVLSDGDHYLG